MLAFLHPESIAVVGEDVVSSVPFLLVEAVPESLFDNLSEVCKSTPAAMGAERISGYVLNALLTLLIACRFGNSHYYTITP